MFYLSGQYEVPVLNLRPPPKELEIRPIDGKFVATIKHEILNSPMISKSPIVCLVDTVAEAKNFDITKINVYQYFTIGGNHRRVAYEELLAEEKIERETCIPATLVFGK